MFPRPAPKAALTEFAQRRGDFAIVSAAVDLDVVDLDAEGPAVRGGRVALGGVAAMPVRVPEAEAVLAAVAPSATAPRPRRQPWTRRATRTAAPRTGGA